jgi:hypothetical protein
MSTASDFFKIKPKQLTGKAKLSAETEKAVKHFLLICSKDKMLLLAIVTGGLHYWKGIAGKAFRGYLVDDVLLERLFHFLVEQAGPEPKAQFKQLQRSGLVALKLDRLKGLARFITSEQHLDEVLDKWISDPAEKAALRGQLLIFWKTQGTAH